MNTPVGFVEENGVVVSATPLAPFLAPASLHEVVHMVIAAFMCVGFGVASVYAVGMLRGKREEYHRRGLGAGLFLGVVFTPIQLVVGDWAVRAVADQRPDKLAAMEGLAHTKGNQPLSLGGVYDGEQLRGAVELPSALSVLLHGRTDAVITGLDVIAPGDRAPVTATHLAFDLMVGIGLALTALSLWSVWRWRRARRGGALLGDSRWFLRAVALSGPGAVVALLAGWVVTEVGRQPWIVYLKLRTADAVATHPGLYWYLYATAVVYLVLAVSLVAILRRLARSGPGVREEATDK
jgi:cytochrome d ubiquinol oxidase subunit I